MPGRLVISVARHVLTILKKLVMCVLYDHDLLYYLTGRARFSSVFSCNAMLQHKSLESSIALCPNHTVILEKECWNCRYL